MSSLAQYILCYPERNEVESKDLRTNGINRTYSVPRCSALRIKKQYRAIIL